MVAAVEINEESDLFEIWEENLASLVMFTRLQTQWNLVQGGFVGLNYQAVAALLKIYKVEDPAAMMDDLIAMESAALPILNKRED